MSDDIQSRIDELRPWRYRHEVDDIVIESDYPPAAAVHEAYGKDIMTHIVSNLIGDRDPGTMRALDMGCLEGHYSDILCAAGLEEVVSIDLSPPHIARAQFLLHELRGYENSAIIEGNVSDEKLMGSLGKFNIILFHGLLYHLKDPLKIFDILERMMTDDGPSYLLLSTQYKGNYAAVVAPYPMAELQIKGLNVLEENHQERLLFSPTDESVFERCSFRLNPMAVYQTLRLYGYQQIIAYDTPGGFTYSYHSNLVASSTPQPGLIDCLNTSLPKEEFYFYEWDGESVDSYAFTRRPLPVLLRLVMRVSNKLLNYLQKRLVRYVMRVTPGRN